MSIEERAEQYAEYSLHHNSVLDKWVIKQAYVAGYNACLEEATHNYNELIAEREKLIPKWHKVADGLPISDKDKFYLIKDKWNYYMIARFFNGVWSNYTTIEDVIAWCEIPKYTEE